MIFHFRCNLNKNFMDKIDEIERNKGIDLNNNNADTFKDIDLNNLLEDYSCINQMDLFIKIYSINQLYETFLRNLIDYSFLLNLKYNNEKWKFEERFQETYSKVLWLKDTIDYLIKELKQSKEKIKSVCNFDIISVENFQILKSQKIRRLDTMNSISNNTMNFEESNVEPLSQYIIKNCDQKFQEDFRRRSIDLEFDGIGIIQGWSNKTLPKISIVEEKNEDDKSKFEDKIRLKDDEIRILKKVLEDCINNNIKAY